MILDNDDPKTLFATAENDLDYMKVDREQAMEVHWSKALQWAQESLLCRDIFKQVCLKFYKNFIAIWIGKIMEVDQTLTASVLVLDSMIVGKLLSSTISLYK